jgi:hypothetical protein
MSGDSVRWLTPLPNDAADHLAGLLDNDAGSAASDAFLQAALLANGLPAASLPPAGAALAEDAGPAGVAATKSAPADAAPAAAAPAPGTPALAGAVPPMALPRPQSAGEAMIRAAVQGKTGLVAVAVPELPYPLWLRAGTADAASCIAALSPDTGGGRIPYHARRILELGAGAGYRTVALARSFPDAEIIAAEPDPAFEKLARLNTLPYRNVTLLTTAVSQHPGRFDFSGRVPKIGALTLAARPGGEIVAHTLKEVLAGPGWDRLDTVIVTPDAASAGLLRANEWPVSVRMIVIDTGGGPLPGPIAAAYPETEYLIRPEGAYVTIYRRTVEAASPPPVAVPVFDPTGPLVDCRLTDVPNLPWSFFVVHPRGFRLHPRPPDQPAPKLTVAAHSNGYNRFTVRLRVGHKDGRPVRFSVKILDEPAGAEIFHAEQVVPGGATETLTADIPVFFGPCRVVFSTEMAEKFPPAQAWAEFLEPVFL